MRLTLWFQTYPAIDRTLPPAVGHLCVNLYEVSLHQGELPCVSGTEVVASYSDGHHPGRKHCKREGVYLQLSQVSHFCWIPWIIWVQQQRSGRDVLSFQVFLTPKSRVRVGAIIRQHGDTHIWSCHTQIFIFIFIFILWCHFTGRSLQVWFSGPGAFLRGVACSPWVLSRYCCLLPAPHGPIKHTSVSALPKLSLATTSSVLLTYRRAAETRLQLVKEGEEQDLREKEKEKKGKSRVLRVGTLTAIARRRMYKLSKVPLNRPASIWFH